MIQFTKPNNRNSVPTPLRDILSDGSRNLYVIEDSLQRPYVWNTITIETICNEIFDMFIVNIRESKRAIYDRLYIQLNEVVFGPVDEINKTSNIFDIPGLKIESCSEGSQRIRTMAIFFLALLFFISNENEEEYVNIERFKNSDDEDKLRVIGDDGGSSFTKLIEYVTKQPVKKIFKDINKKDIEKCRSKFSNNDEKNLIDTFLYIGKLISIKFYEENLPYKECTDIFLNNLFVFKREEKVEEKIKTFIDSNRLVVPMAEEHYYPKFIINKLVGEEKKVVYEAYQKFVALAKKIEEEKIFIKTKGGAKPELFIETKVLDLQLARKGYKNLKHKYSLGDYDYGVEAVMNKGYHLTSYEDILEYFSECITYANFILESFKNHEDKTINTYYFRNIWNDKMALWWSFYTPCYLMCDYLNNDIKKRQLVNDLLYKSYVQFILSWAFSESNRDSYSNILCRLGDIIIKHRDSEYAIFENKCLTLMAKQIEYNGNSWEKMNINLRDLSYMRNDNEKMAIKQILLAQEKYLVDTYNFSDEALFDAWTKHSGKEINLDHWLPNSISEDNEELHYASNRLGNFVLLESNLNQSKGNDFGKNNQLYCQSSFIGTKLMSKEYICGISTDKKEIMNNDEYVIRYDVDTINNPKIDNINQRKRALMNFIISYIKPNV